MLFLPPERPDRLSIRRDTHTGFPVKRHGRGESPVEVGGQIHRKHGVLIRSDRGATCARPNGSPENERLPEATRAGERTSHWKTTGVENGSRTADNTTATPQSTLAASPDRPLDRRERRRTRPVVVGSPATPTAVTQVLSTTVSMSGDERLVFICCLL